jgi:CHAD domain-containing protein
MTTPGNPSPGRTGLCWFALQKLPALLDAFTREAAGVEEAQDIEYIHRMRVASRRLRAALPLFRTCFPEKQYRKWMAELTKITRALGEARDADVQITFLQKLLKRLEKDEGSQKTAAPADKKPTMKPAVHYLLAARQKKRALLQKRVLSALSSLKKSRVCEDIQGIFAFMNTAFSAERGRPVLRGIPPVAALRIGKRLATLLSYEPWVRHPEAVAEHHATRIAAKKLRYTMEIYGPVYRNGLKKPLARVKKIQEILGDLHDCDVWIDHITLLLLQERSLLRTAGKTKRPDTATLSSLKVFLQDRENERKRRYRQFVRYWHALSRAGLWEDLKKMLISGRKARFRTPASYTEPEAMKAVHLLAQQYPEGQDHSRHVTSLALMLFDKLQSLRNLNAHDRLLLESAGLLHDIGWKFGQAGHNRRGAEMVFSDEHLPFDPAERGVIGLVILSHRGRVCLSSHPYFLLLSPGFQEKTKILAALLRVADGLDYTHNGTVGRLTAVLPPMP